MRLTYGNKLGGVPRTNIRVPEDEPRYSPILNQDGTRNKLEDWRLYFKPSSEGGILPEYIKDSEMSLRPLGENGEFEDGSIAYAIRDIRLVPIYDETNTRLTTIIAGNVIPGRWDLVADIYLYLKRKVVINSIGQTPIEEVMSGILKSDVLLASGQLEYKIEDCLTASSPVVNSPFLPFSPTLRTIQSNTNQVSWYYKFSVEEIESLSGLDFKQKSNTTGSDVDLVERLKQERLQPQDVRLDQPLTIDLPQPPTLSEKPFYKKMVPLIKRGTVPKGQGVVPEAGEFISNLTGEIVTWDGFTLDSNEIRVNENGGTETHDNPITQNIVWQTIWKTWMGYKFDNVSIDPTNPRLDDGKEYYDGIMLALEADGHPLQSDFAEGYYIPRKAKWLRVSTRLDDDGYENICRGKTKCVEKLPNDDCTKLPFVITDVKRRTDLDKYNLLSKDTSKFYPIPGRPCYQGLPAKYDALIHYEHTSSKECFDGRVGDDGRVYGSRTIKYQYEIVSSSQVITEWENIIRNSIDKTCECIEVSVQNPPYIDPNDPNECDILHTDTIFTVCPDDGNYYYENRIVPPNAIPNRLEIRHIDRTKCNDMSKPAVFHQLSFEKDLLHAENLHKTAGTFAGNGLLEGCFTSSLQSPNSKLYYTDICIANDFLEFDFVWSEIQSTWKVYIVRFSENTYTRIPIINREEIVCFSLLYANKYGSGSKVIGEREKDSTSKTNYNQYKLLTLDDFKEEYKFYNMGLPENSSDEFYALKFNSELMLDKIDPGNLQFSLKASDGTIYHFIDDSNDLTNDKFYMDVPNIHFNIVSGSLLDGIHSSGLGSPETNPSYTTYGVFYPKLGIIIFDPNKLKNVIGINSNLTTNYDAKNELLLFDALNNAIKSGHPFLSRSSLKDVSTNYFIRVPAHHANYSNNPTFAHGANGNGRLKNKKLFTEPFTYVTTVGLYDSENNLVAVGKLSKPFKKTMERELLLNIRLSI